MRVLLTRLRTIGVGCAVGLLTLCALISMTRCQRTTWNEPSSLNVQVLSDFVLVGSAPYDARLVPADARSVPVHEMKELPLPSEFTAGYQYVFHHKQSLGENADVYQNLLTKLQAQDVKITSANASVDRYVGGPGFRITFQGTGFKGVIFNSLDGKIVTNDALIRQWSVDDYILFLEKT